MISTQCSNKCAKFKGYFEIKFDQIVGGGIFGCFEVGGAGGGINGSYVISPFWSGLEWGIACEAQQGSTLSPTGASAKGLHYIVGYLCDYLRDLLLCFRPALEQQILIKNIC